MKTRKKNKLHKINKKKEHEKEYSEKNISQVVME